MSGLHIVAEAVLRIEHKLDAILRHLKIPMPAPMHFAGSLCPACGQMIDYQVDFQHQVAVRRCGCKTGKVPSAIPLFPVDEKKHAPGIREDYAQDSEEREEGRHGHRELRGPGRP